MLEFIGKGSAFNTSLGNNSCYIKKDDCMLLIDAGGTIFHKLQELNAFEGLKRLDIIITHTHPDHCGSLGECIFYPYFNNKIKPTVYFPQRELMESYFKIIGVKEEMCSLVSDMEVTLKGSSIGVIGIRFIKVLHVETMPAFGFILEVNKKKVYYSGDASDIPEEILSLLKSGILDMAYQDTCGLDYDGNAHLSIGKLTQLIPEKYRHKIYCMHIDKALDTDMVFKMGFNIV